jgi:tetratricopeptide (TPR) repeat protein
MNALLQRTPGRMWPAIAALGTCLACAAVAHDAAAYNECGDLANAYGPYDYRTSRDKLLIVEGAHFTEDVESLRRGRTGPVGGDIDYTLRASPNHPRALIAMANLGRLMNTEQPPGAHYSVACYFDRAIRFASDDPIVRLVYGTYLYRVGKPHDAIKQLEIARSLDPDNANIHYNLGLIYLDLKDYPKAREHAERAYALGFALPGLRKRLEEAGQWTAQAAIPATDAATKGKAPEPK